MSADRYERLVALFKQKIEPELDLEKSVKAYVEHAIEVLGRCSALLYLPRVQGEWTLAAFAPRDFQSEYFEQKGCELTCHVDEILCRRQGTVVPEEEARHYFLSKAFVGEPFAAAFVSNEKGASGEADSDVAAVVFFRYDQEFDPEAVACVSKMNDIFGAHMKQVVAHHVAEAELQQQASLEGGPDFSP